MIDGYMGRFLYVDLDTRNSQILTVPQWLKDNYDGLVYPDMIIQFIDKERIKMIEPPIDPPYSYWGYEEEEEEDYSLELSKIEKEK